MFNLDTPPSVAGVYLLKNKKTNEMYIGSTYDLCKRLSQWRNKSAGLITITTPADWNFYVLQECPGLGPKALRRLETQAILKVHKTSPHLLLNQNFGNGERVAPGRFVIYNDDDEPIRYKDAAALLRLSYNALSARISRLRSRGYDKITLNQLRQPRIFSVRDPPRPPQ